MKLNLRNSLKDVRNLKNKDDKILDKTEELPIQKELLPLIKESEDSPQINPIKLNFKRDASVNQIELLKKEVKELKEELKKHKK